MTTQAETTHAVNAIATALTAIAAELATLRAAAGQTTPELQSAVEAIAAQANALAAPAA